MDLEQNELGWLANHQRHEVKTHIKSSTRNVRRPWSWQNSASCSLQRNMEICHNMQERI